MKIKFKKNINLFLLQGNTPEKLALCIVLGVGIGIMPLIGLTTIICGIVALIFRLNMPVIQFANYIVFPLQITLLFPFFSMGQNLYGNYYIPFSISTIIEMVKTNFWDTLGKFWMSNLMAISVWLIFIIPFSVVFYYLLLIVIRRLYTANNFNAL